MFALYSSIPKSFENSEANNYNPLNFWILLDLGFLQGNKE